MKRKFTMDIEERPIVYRERSVVRGGFVSSHRTPQLKVWQDTISVLALQKRALKPILEGPLRFTVEFFYKGRKNQIGRYRTIRPDLTNLEKAIEDALQGVWFEDDSQIASKISLKKFGSRTVVVITVEEI